MFNRWRTADILIALLVGLTITVYFLYKPAFRICLWILVIAALIRLLIIVKKSPWKIRNRLIFSAVFFVATPLFLIVLFFRIIGNVVITYLTF